MENKKINHSNILSPAASIKKTRKEDLIPDGNYFLRLLIHNAEGIDPPSKRPGVTSRNYQVLSWINPAHQYATAEVEGFPRLVWNQPFEIPMKKVAILEPKYLSLEVIRVRSYCDPGPSSGVVVVGRVKVPLPKPGIKKCRRIGLVRFDEGAIIGEGHITITMKLCRRNS